MPLCQPLSAAILLLHYPGAQPRIFVVGNGAGFPQPFEFFDLVRGAEADDLAKLVTGLLCPLAVALAMPRLCEIGYANTPK
jgi:hypothetical protein